jgi:hypothetical protein
MRGRGAGRSVAPACVALYLAVVLGLLLSILHRDDHIFTYTLDDPYIHLALAENLAHWHYGINAGEAASPSSSIVWPFLLVPAARWEWGQYVPLGLNVLFCGIAAWWIGRIADGWSFSPADRDEAAMNGAGGETAGPSTAAPAVSAPSLRMTAPSGLWVGRFGMAAALMLVANLVGLTFVGMEHGLQVLVAVACAAGMVEAFAGRSIPRGCLWAAALGPMVRYEDFALVAGIALVLVAQGRRGTAMRLAGASVAGPAVFSVFLLWRGLPALPTSVLVKARAYSIGGAAKMEAIRLKYWGMEAGTMREYAWWALFDIAALLVFLAVREKQPVRRAVLRGALLAACLQLGVGQFNWFHRYEVYAVLFTMLVAMTALVESTRVWRTVLVAGALAVSFPYAHAVWQTPAAASNIYQQQYQMHRFEADFYRQAVAVNDLGWVSYRRPAGASVLDLWGLASAQASREANKDAGWLDMMTETHRTGLAMVYPDWYVKGAPDDWDPLATMCITGMQTSVSRRCVVFFSTGVGNKALLTEEIAAFTRTLPASVHMTLGRNSSDEHPN